MTVYTVAASTIHDYQVRLLDLMRAGGIRGPVLYAYRTERGPYGQRWSEEDFRRTHLRPADGRTIFDNEIVLDFDIQKYEAWPILAGEFNKVHFKLEAEGIPHWPAYSGGNGAHIHIFFNTDQLERVIVPKVVRYSIANALVRLLGDQRLDIAWLRAESHIVREFGSGKETYFSKTLVDQLPSDRTMLLEQLRFPERLEVWTIPQWFIDRDGELLEDLRKGCRGTGYAPAEYQYVVYKHPEEQEFPQWLGEAACPERAWSDSGPVLEGISSDWVAQMVYTGDSIYMRDAANQLDGLLSALIDKCIRGPALRPETVQAECEGIQIAADEIREQVIWGLRRFAEGAARRKAAAGTPAVTPPTPEQAQGVISTEIQKTILPFLKALLHYVQDSEKVVNYEWLNTYDERAKTVHLGRIRTWAAVHGALDFYIHALQTAYETRFIPAVPWRPPR